MVTKELKIKDIKYVITKRLSVYDTIQVHIVTVNSEVFRCYETDLLECAIRYNEEQLELQYIGEIPKDINIFIPKICKQRTTDSQLEIKGFEVVSHRLIPVYSGIIGRDQIPELIQKVLSLETREI